MPGPSIPGSLDFGSLASRLSRLEAFREAELEQLARTAEERFAAIREFRKSLADMSTLMVTRTEFLTNQEALRALIDQQAKRIDFNTSRLDKIEGSHAGITAYAGWALALFGIFVSAAVTWLVYIHGK